MWRRLFSQLQPCLRSARSVSSLSSKTTTPRFLIAPSSSSSSSSTTPSISSNLFQRNFSAQPDSVLDKGKKIEDVMPIATGHEKEELEALLAGRDLAEMDHPVGPFGTKEEPAVIKSVYDKRIVGCPGGEGEDEHDVVWFWLEKGKPYECPVCTQYFVLEVVGPGGPPDGHGDNHH